MEKTWGEDGTEEDIYIIDGIERGNNFNCNVLRWNIDKKV